MFNPAKKSNEQSNGYSTSSSGKTSIIGLGLLIKGEIITEDDLRIDGKLVGNITSTSKVVIGETGIVEGNIEANVADITGKVTGNLFIKELLDMRQHAVIIGDVVASKISMEPTVTFNGKCTMGSASANVVEMRKETDERRVATE